MSSPPPAVLQGSKPLVTDGGVQLLYSSIKKVFVYMDTENPRPFNSVQISSLTVPKSLKVYSSKQHESAVSFGLVQSEDGSAGLCLL